MSVRDAKLALGEMRTTIGPAHAKEVEALIARAEAEAAAPAAQQQAPAPSGADNDDAD